MSNNYLGMLLVGIAAASPSFAHSQQEWALESAKIYVSPDQPPVSGKIVIAGAKIRSVVPKSNRSATAVARQCDGGIVVAGFQNSHVHITNGGVLDMRREPAQVLENALSKMLMSYGYTTVFDIAADPEDLSALRDRIERGELHGPRILGALPLFPPHGLPFYIANMPKPLLDKLKQPNSVDEALQSLREGFAAGMDGTKLFIATPQAGGTIKRMPADIARVAVEETHRRGKLVFAHPTDFQGIRDAIAAGVDILAHPPLDAPSPWPEPLIKQVRDAGMFMIPTLKLLQFELEKQQVPAAIAERLVNNNVAEFGKFVASGGKVLFGTDVGYVTDYDPTREYELMAQAGLTPMQILASLTTTPAARWQEQKRRGRIAAGMDADLVVLDADPADSPRNFASVRCAIRSGAVIYSRPQAARGER